MVKKLRIIVFSLLTCLGLLFSVFTPVYANETKHLDEYSLILSIPLGNSGLEYQSNGEGYFSGPASFAVKGNVIYILDGEKNRVFVYQDGVKTNEFQVIGLESASDIRVSDNVIYVLDNETKKLASFQLDGTFISTVGLDNFKTKGILTLDLEKDNAVLRTENGSIVEYAPNLKEISKENGHLSFNNSKQKRILTLPGSESPITISSNELLGSMILNHIDKNGFIYITTEEIVDAPEIIVEQTVRKYDKKGLLIGITRVPLELYQAHPYRYTDVTDDGIFALVPKIDSIDIVKLNITDNFVSNLPQLKEKFYSNYETQEANEPSTNVLRVQYLTRQQVENFGYNMNTNNWTLNSNNRKNMSNVTVPDWLQSVSIPYNASGIPYCWGGFDSLNTSSCGSWNNYNSAMSYGANAGNVNCNEYWKSGTAGLDCSGYVSQCFGFTTKWGTGDFYNNTSLFQDVTVSQLQNCDIVVHPTSHIVLWKGTDWGNSNHFFTYEATTSGLDKCKDYDRYWSNFSGYKCRTYKYFN